MGHKDSSITLEKWQIAILYFQSFELDRKTSETSKKTQNIARNGDDATKYRRISFQIDDNTQSIRQ